MRIAYIGHTYHQSTKSTEFLIEILRELGEITCLWDDRWRTGNELDIGPVLAGCYDLIVIFQIEYLAQIVARSDHPNTLFVPMFDGCKDLPDRFWKSLKRTRVLCFCHALHQRAKRAGLESAFFQYYPDPNRFTPVVDWVSLRGYFWQRKPTLSWLQVRALLGDATFTDFVLHCAPDPDTQVQPVLPSDDDRERYRIRLTSWHQEAQENLNRVAAANIYFAPRLFEGIGMSFIEAMAMGMAVVAPNHPTMNEYIVHGVNGFLYDPSRLEPIDFSRAREIGVRARLTIERGHAEWRRRLHEMREFVRAPLGEIASVVPWLPVTRTAKRTSYAPRVTVATVVFNARDAFLRTLGSVAAQDYENFEYIVIDGGSSDGTLEAIREHERLIDIWFSESDRGPYDAMTKAARCARGEFIIFMNAGDSFASPHALAAAMHDPPADADFIVGHHLYRYPPGVDAWHRAADFETTWSRLQQGRIDDWWLHGVPGHQATLTRVSILRDCGYDLSYQIAADHEFLFRQYGRGGRVHHSDVTIAIYVSGGLSGRNELRCTLEWQRLALAHGPNRRAIRAYYRMRMERSIQSTLEIGDWKAAWDIARQHPALAWRAFTRALGPSPLRRRWERWTTGESLTVDFTAPHMPALVSDVAGLSHCEGWGTWTEEKELLLRFARDLPPRFEVQLRFAHVFTASLDGGVVLVAGADQKSLAIGPDSRSAEATLAPGGAIRELRLQIPGAKSPRDCGIAEDDRQLGLGLVSIRLRETRGREEGRKSLQS